MNTPNPDYPKWMRKLGTRDVQVQSAEEEATKREEGYSHEVIPSQQQPPLGSTQPTPPMARPGSATEAPAAPTVPLASYEQALERAETRRAEIVDKFNEAWNKKCAELAGVMDQLAKANAELATLKADAVNKKPGPVKPPVTAKEGDK